CGQETGDYLLGCAHSRHEAHTSRVIGRARTATLPVDLNGSREDRGNNPQWWPESTRTTMSVVNDLARSKQLPSLHLIRQLGTPAARQRLAWPQRGPDWSTPAGL